MSRALDAPPDALEPLPMPTTQYCREHGCRSRRFVIHEYLGIPLCAKHLSEVLRAEWRSFRDRHGLAERGRLPHRVLEAE